MPGSLTSSLFGKSNSDNTDGIFGSSSPLFAQAVRDRVEENKAKVKRAKIVVDKEYSDTVEDSDQEIIARRKAQAEVQLVEDVTCQAVHPANDTDSTVEEESDHDSVPADVQVQETAGVVRNHGFAVVRNVVPRKILEAIATRADEIEQQVCSALDARGIQWRDGGGETEMFRFHEIASRCAGRMDLRHETSTPPFSDPTIVENISLLPVIHSLLGGTSARDAAHMPCLVYVGLILSFPGSDNQPWHQDGMPLFTELSGSSVPPYALNIFLPLTDEDTSLEAGPTEFIPGSHRLPEDQVMAVVDREKRGPVETSGNEEEQPGIVGPLLQQGDALIYDYRVCHRGTSNLTHHNGKARVRKILYLMYARPWFKEHLNFGTDKLF
jgi:hypothetical protein